MQVEQNRQHFYELSLEYVCKLQEIQERKKFEFVEPVSITESCSAITFNRYPRTIFLPRMTLQLLGAVVHT